MAKRKKLKTAGHMGKVMRVKKLTNYSAFGIAAPDRRYPGPAEIPERCADCRRDHCICHLAACANCPHDVADHVLDINAGPCKLCYCVHFEERTDVQRD